MGKLSPTLKDTLETMQRNGYKLLKLINNLLDLNKLEEGRMRLKVQSRQPRRIRPALARLGQAPGRPEADPPLFPAPAPCRRADDRPGPVREGRLQPALQRPQVHQQRRQDHDLHRGQGPHRHH
ncbi:MAG: hypothetical protein MZU79_06420 [Anaerotruncus sp.]|nr:hypothetical protein [Anaerotruncus sp.]